MTMIVLMKMLKHEEDVEDDGDFEEDEDVEDDGNHLT